MEEVTCTYKTVVLIPKEETVERPGLSFKGSSKMCLGEIRNEGVGWIKLAQNWVWYWECGDILMDFEVKSRKLLSQLGNCN